MTDIMDLIHDNLDWASGLGTWSLTGSNYICDPPVKNTDVDVIWSARYCKNKDLIHKAFLSHGFIADTDSKSYPEMDKQVFTSYRKGSLNVIVCYENEFYERFVTATEVAKELNLLNKRDRIILFQAILYNRMPHS